jgi:4a-hydroxytetrahydrobiopterin dehydratase
MPDLTKKKCTPCQGGVAALTRTEALGFLARIDQAWSLADNSRSIQRELSFKDFYRTMSFVNAVAHLANIEDHHPHLEIGYNYCRIIYTTHAIEGLSENDFICAAKVDQIPLE